MTGTGCCCARSSVEVVLTGTDAWATGPAAAVVLGDAAGGAGARKAAPMRATRAIALNRLFSIGQAPGPILGRLVAGLPAALCDSCHAAAHQSDKASGSKVELEPPAG